MTNRSSPGRTILRFGSRAAALALATGLVAVSAHAQTADAGAPAEDAGDIVVTALRRDTTVQTTPLAITALTGDTLTKAGVTNIADYAKFVPSLRIQDNGPGQRRVSLRGVQASGEATVGVYYDDTPVAGSVGVSSDAAGRTADFTLFDVNRVEVLRGPQGTLYGSGSMGGAIRVIYNKPTQDYEGTVEGQASTTKGGGFNYFVNAMVNVPVVKDLLAVRAVLYRRDSAGYIDNTFLGRNDTNSYTATGGRLIARFTPASNVTIDGTAMFENTDAFSASWNPQVGTNESATQVMLPYTDRSQLYSLNGKWDMGGVTLTSITSYQHRRSAYAADDSYFIASYRNPTNCKNYVNSGIPSATRPDCTAPQLSNYYGYIDSLGPAAIYYPGSTKDFTQELRLSSDKGKLFDWTVGAFYENRKNYVTSEDARADKATGDIIFPNQIIYRRQIFDKLEQFAAFGEGTFHATSKLDLTAGIRYYDYKKTVQGNTDIAWVLIGAPATPLTTVNSSEHGTLLKFNVSWQANKDMMFYATASQGFRPGGANQVIGLPADLTPYQSDSLWNYEVGSKLTLLDRKLTLNLAAFQIDWDNMQVSARTSTNNGAFSFLTNAGAARIRGLEAEAFVRPTRSLQINLSGNYLDAKLTEDQLNAAITASGTSARAGDRIPYIPHFSGAAGAEYRVPVSSSVEFFARGDFNYVGSSYSQFRPTDPNQIKMAAYSLTNIRVGFEMPESNTGIYLFVNNVFDAVAINRASKSSTANSYSVTSAAPRTIGINVRRSF